MISKLIEKIQVTGAPVCVGLDPMLDFVPEHILDECFKEYGESFEAAAEAIWRFNKEIIDATFDLIPAVKPQIAMYEQFAVEGMLAYKKTVDYAKSKGLIVIGDAKRGDIGSTSLAYAHAHLGKTKVGSSYIEGFSADMLTVNPYLGIDGIQPFIDICKSEDRAIFVLVKTSNPSSGDFQDRLVDGRPLYEEVAAKLNQWGSSTMEGAYSNVGAVVGATYPQQSKELRRQMPHSYFLVPGYGAQGGKAEDLRYCFNDDGLGAIVNSSRAIIAAYKLDKYAKDFSPKDFALASRRATIDMIEDINSVL